MSVHGRKKKPKVTVQECVDVAVRRRIPDMFFSLFDREPMRVSFLPEGLDMMPADDFVLVAVSSAGAELMDRGKNLADIETKAFDMAEELAETGTTFKVGQKVGERDGAEFFKDVSQFMYISSPDTVEIGRMAQAFGQEILEVEVFRTGVWNGDKYVAKDLDDMVAAFDKVGFKPPVKLGHSEKSGDPAFGWVTSLKREGNKLVANLTDLPDKIFQAIKDKRFDAVSSEVFWNLTRNGTKFRRALKAVALLGAEIPAVSDLKPVSESLKDLVFSSDGEHTYVIKRADDMTDKVDKTEFDKAQAKVAELTAQLAKLEDNKGPGEVEKLEAKIAQLETDNKDARVREHTAQRDQAVAKLRVPALRDHVAALYDLAQSSERTVTFGKEDKASPVVVVEALITQVNKASAQLFKELGSTGGFKRDDEPASDDAGTQLHQLTQKHMRDNKEATYSQAFHAVLDNPNNEDVKMAYLQQSRAEG